MGRLMTESKAEAQGLYGGALALYGRRDMETGRRFLEVFITTSNGERISQTVPALEAKAILRWLEVAK